jgi:hypothetical protein
MILKRTCAFPLRWMACLLFMACATVCDCHSQHSACVSMTRACLRSLGMWSYGLVVTAWLQLQSCLSSKTESACFYVKDYPQASLLSHLQWNPSTKDWLSRNCSRWALVGLHCCRVHSGWMHLTVSTASRWFASLTLCWSVLVAYFPVWV